MRRGREGTLKDEAASESGPDEAALDTGEGLRMVKETFEDMMVQRKNVVLHKPRSSSSSSPVKCHNPSESSLQLEAFYILGHVEIYIPEATLLATYQVRLRD